MAVTDEIKREAADLEQFRDWKIRLSRLIPIGYAYGRSGEPRRYYMNGSGQYYYREVTEAEMHSRK